MQGRGLDDLPDEQRVVAAECLARSLEPAELMRAFRVTMDALLEEVRRTDLGLASKLEPSLRLLVTSSAYDKWNTESPTGQLSQSR